MKNIVKVLRLKDNAARLYVLPENITVEKGNILLVEFPDANSTCLGVAVSDSYKVDGDMEKMVAQMHRMENLDTLKRVISGYEECKLDWSEPAVNETEETMEAM